jgi:hypothetical protein
MNVGGVFDDSKRKRKKGRITSTRDNGTVDDAADILEDGNHHICISEMDFIDVLSHTLDDF